MYDKGWIKASFFLLIYEKKLITKFFLSRKEKLLNYVSCDSEAFLSPQCGFYIFVVIMAFSILIYIGSCSDMEHYSINQICCYLVEDISMIYGG